MPPERWQKVKELFNSALALDPQERAGVRTTASGISTGFRVTVDTQKKVTSYNKLMPVLAIRHGRPGGNQIVHGYAEVTGNIWIMDLKYGKQAQQPLRFCQLL